MKLSNRVRLYENRVGLNPLKGEMIDSPVESIVGNTSPLTPKSSASVWLKKELGGGFYVAGGGRYEDELYLTEQQGVAWFVHDG